MKRSKATPAQLVGLIILGTLIVASAFLVVPHGSHYRGDCNGGFLGFSFISHLIVMCMFFGGGGYLGWWAQQELTCGIRLERWNEEQLRSIRKYSESWVAKTGPIILLFVGVVFYLTETSQHHSSSVVYWVCFVLCHGQMALNRSLAPPIDSQSASRLESSAPLRSEHWGE
ncbi:MULTISPECIES: hypothetical protein [Acidobacteriaceae]|uniref:hypothetical protein n=1 Tax=Acidobacteriaceae TaxID=204434 RepID=UPI00131A86EB|nr:MULTISPECIES: hypothetical protein [Acidobacteriaceae]MDW5267777.1 hypothetical protein [Edaphobacter sp.]